jgi:Fe-S-cluster containining protein
MDPDAGLPDMPEEEKERIVAAMMRMMELGVAAVYNDEDEGLPDAPVDCAGRLSECKARCCTLNFALTRSEAAGGAIRHNPERPFFIARDPDGYCPHMDRRSYACNIYDTRPLRCRRYDCKVEG